MNVIPLFKEDILHKKREEKRQIEIPSGWWESTYSHSFQRTEQLTKAEVIEKKSTKLPATPGWDLSKGDYRVKDSMSTYDYVYYRDLKIKLIKYLVYPAVIITIITIFKISAILAKI